MRGADPAPGGVLAVVAVDEEAVHLPPWLSVVVTGAGPVNAAIATTAAVLALHPGEVVGLGTAGALVEGLAGTYEVGEVRQHDLDDAALLALTGRSSAPALHLGDGPVLTTGGAFVAGGPLRERLAASGAQLVDMEGYAVARAAAALGVPVRLVKHVSDAADERAPRTWPETVEACSRALGAWCAAALPHA
ncbi:nucleoside phosphorylase [Vallicoccus soli]|uniref:Nucleoside phosphorylase n=1 Tax=Vallicoccus soli TaxID=2339232 RepID=A0A3A3ZI04_9ACTN|nr:nucleoside phosphorylase [Vallicoccus soli]